MASRWFTAAERPELSEAMADWASGWPAFVFHDDVADRTVRARWPGRAHVDPWLRTHERAGGTVLGVAHQTMVVTGTVAEWERWTDLPLPCSGEHVVPGALAPVLIELDADRGRYEEPNVWVHHTTAPR